MEKWDAKKPDATADSDNESPTKPAAEEPKRRLLKKRPRAEDASDTEPKEAEDNENENKSGNDDDNENENDGASEPAAEAEDDGGGARKRGRRTIVKAIAKLRHNTDNAIDVDQDVGTECCFLR